MYSFRFPSYYQLAILKYINHSQNTEKCEHLNKYAKMFTFIYIFAHIFFMHNTALQPPRKGVGCIGLLGFILLYLTRWILAPQLSGLFCNHRYIHRLVYRRAPLNCFLCASHLRRHSEPDR